MESIRTNDHMPTDPTAVFGRRCVAFAIDFGILFVVMLIAFLSLSTFEVVSDPDVAEQICVHYDDLDNGDVCFHDETLVFVLEQDTFANIVILVITAALLNLVIIAAITGGSLGKLAAGIRVVDQYTFERAGVLKHLLRLLLWIVDSFPWFLLVPLTGLIVSLVSKGHRRVADFAAKTLVVDKKYVDVPTLVPGVNDATMVPTTLPGLWNPPVQPPPTQAPVTEPAFPVQTTATHETDRAPDTSDDIEGRYDQIAPTAKPHVVGQDQASQTEADAPMWDAARDTYIQWDHDLEEWMEWSESAGRWIPISQ